jgi:integrase
MLTDTAIKQLRPDPQRVKKLFDGSGTGLHLLCHPTGRKTFAIKYSHPVTRRDQTLTIGEYPSVSLRTARQRAEEARELRSRGLDPRELERRVKEKARAASEDTFQQLAQEWISVRGARWSATYRSKIQSRLKQHLYPAIGKTVITELTAPTLLSVLRPIEASCKTDLAHSLLRDVAAIFRFTIAAGRAVNDPAAALRGALSSHRAKNLPAVTTPVELAELLRALDGYQGEYVTKAALEFTLLTFQRSQSIRFACWNQIDWTGRLWRIPAEIMKMKEPHLVPLSTQAVALLQSLQPLTGESDYIFPSLLCRSKPLSENTMLYALVRLGYRGRMSVHGFRSTASTLLNENGHNPDVIEAALAHVRGDVRSIYNRARYLPDRVKMYQWWADFVDGLRQRDMPCSTRSDSRVFGTQ